MNNQTENQYVFLKIPEKAWELITETLEMNTGSSHVSRANADEIYAATRQIKTIEINVLAVVQSLYRILLKFKQYYPAIFPAEYDTALEAAKIAINELKSESHDPSESVSLIAGGYEWHCPNCNAENSETAWIPKVCCQTCGGEFAADHPARALDK